MRGLRRCYPKECVMRTYGIAMVELAQGSLTFLLWDEDDVFGGWSAL